MKESIRLFIAARLSKDIKEELRTFIEEMKHSGKGVKWVNTENIHLTLKFLGDTGSSGKASVREKLRTLKGKFAPFDLKTGPIGVFPSWKRPRVIWAGVEDPEGSISELAGYIENIMADLGFKKEERAYVPHLTLGRVRGRVDVRKLKTLAEGIDPPAEGHRINKIDLIMSELLPGGARYTVIEEIELG